MLALSLWVPDVQKVLGRVFAWDQFRNWDSSIMLPGWAYTQGQGLNTDIISSWGMGAVVFISRCSQMLGGFDHAHVLMVLMVMTIIYYGVLYAFLRVWFCSILLSAAVIAIVVKLQMFHTGISPLIWIFPQDTPVRYWLDVPVLWCLWRHGRRLQGRYLVWAACGIGAALAWQFSTGLCLLAAFLGVCDVFNYDSDIAADRFLYGLLPLIVMGAILFCIGGSAVFHPEFWKNLFEPMRLFLQGVGTLSFYTCLYDRHFFAFIAGFVVPVIYAWTLICYASSYKKSPREELFLVPLCIYGLSLYMHYLAHASISHYYAVGIPVVMVIGFWLSKIMPVFPKGGD